MDHVKKEHERLWKKLTTSQNIKNVQSTIDLLQSARDSIAAGWFIPKVRCPNLLTASIPTQIPAKHL